ncbi:MAG: hypothetical protein WBN44_02250 [Woeseiaceae bacterium]
MTGVIASAPGKAVLSGEYAVLRGAPAVSMAVSRRARVSVTPADTAWHRVSAPGYSATEGRFVVEGQVPRWLQGADDYRLVDAAWRTLRKNDSGFLSIELDSRAFFDARSGSKVGLGSSAALTVALTAALTESPELLDNAIRVHKLFQSDAGSGVDIATSAHGGLLEYRMQGATIAPCQWPDGLECRLVWTGVPAATTGKLARFDKGGRRASLDKLVSASTAMAQAWRSAEEVLAQFPAYVQALAEFSDDYDLGIFDAGHAKLTSQAKAEGLVYKPCGAGGGDVGILLGTKREQLDEFLVEHAEPGCRVLECGLETSGVALERR